MTGEGTIEQVLAGEARWCVVCADCLDVLPTLPDKSVDHVIVDGPYSAQTHSKSRAGARKTPLLDGNGRMSRCAIDREVDFGFAPLKAVHRRAFARHWARVARRWVMTFSDVESAWLWRLSLSAAGLDYVRTGAWFKVGATPQFTGDRPGVGFEAITIAHPRGKKRWSGGGSLGVWSHLTAIDRGSPSGSGERCHPTQKPYSLMAELVELFSDADDLVLDDHAGSGTTGVAALRLGRRVILIEREPKWAELCRERLRAEESNSTLRAARAGQLPMFGKVEP